MSDFRTVFNVVVPCTFEQRDLLVKMTVDEAKQAYPGYGEMYVCALAEPWDQVAQHVVLWSDEFGRPGDLADVLAKWQQVTHNQAPIKFQWAGLEDDKVVDCGGVIVYEGEWHWLYVPDMLKAKVKELGISLELDGGSNDNDTRSI